MNQLVYNSEGPNKMHAQAEALIGQNQFHSLQWLMTQNGNVKSTGSLGVETDFNKIQSPLYRIYSMTKPIVSFVAMQLIDENKLKHDDVVAQYIPGFSSLKVLNANANTEPLQTQITIEHLLTHTAGLSYDFLPDCDVAARYRDHQLSQRADRSLSEVVALLCELPLASHPGQQWRYSVATDVLAHVLEKITGQNLPQILQERVFDPLGMQDTAFNVPQSKFNRLLPMYGARELGQVMVESDEPNTLNLLDVESSYPIDGFYRGGHGLFSTMQDYVKFMHVLATGQSVDGQRLLSEPTFDLMWSNRISPALMPLELGFNVLGGYGWNFMGRVMLDPSQCEFKTATGEGGWAGAASTYFWIDKANAVSGIVMSQYLGSNAHLGALMHHAGYSSFTSA